MTGEAPSKARFADYLELTKPRLSLLSVVTALVGYFAARPGPDPRRVLFLALGASLAAGGVAALNQWIECDTDARMNRTAQRPIPTGRVATGSAFVLGWAMCFAALIMLFTQVGRLSALFTLLTIASYLGCYTPAKRTSRWSTEIGAVAGAFPPLIGWSAAEGGVSALGWILFGILFFWQIPHFMAIAWIYRSDYRAVNFPMLPVRDETGGKVARWSIAATACLVLVSLLPPLLGLASLWYGSWALAVGACFLWRAAAFLRAADRDAGARRLFLFSLAYLPLLLGALVADRLLIHHP
jgi:protoheme IX farnesyltransferase